MKLSLSSFVRTLAALAVLGGLRPVLAADPKPDQVEKMEKALPATALVKPAKPHKVLVYTLASGFEHSSIPLGAKTFEALGKKTGAFEVTKITDDPAVFDAATLKDFDMIVLMSTTGDFLTYGNDYIKKHKIADNLVQAAKDSESTHKQNLLDFVSNGGGLVGIHAATDAYYKWHEYGQMIGGYFQNHPYGKITIKIDDPSSPLTAQFEGKDFEFSDEIYVFKQDDVFSRSRLRVLMSINTEKSNLKEQARKDGDYAVAWIKQYGKGRVFYTLLGHNEGTYMNPLTVKFFLAGAQFALGDLKADATPPGSSKSEK